MSEHRFYAGEDAPADLKPGAELSLPVDAAHRVARVLRPRNGDQITVFGPDREFACELTETGRQVRAHVLSERQRAAEQCSRRTIPAVGTPIPFSAALSQACGRIVLFIGPGGGWSEAEVEQAGAAGATLLGLGANVLRAETAEIVATGLLLVD